MDNRSKNGTVGYGVRPEIWFSVLGGFTMEDGKVTQVQLHPISLGQNLPRSQKGVPVLTGDEEVLRYVYEDGYSVEQIARAMATDVNLVAIKAAALKEAGHPIELPDHNTRFLQ
jgi:hypothetical protein